MSQTMELMVCGAAVLVSVSQREDGKYTAKVNGRPEIQVIAETVAGALAKVYSAVQNAMDLSNAA